MTVPKKLDDLKKECTVSKSSMSRKMNTMVANLVDSSAEGSVKSKIETGKSVLNEEVFESI